MGSDAPVDAYNDLGRALRDLIQNALPDNWNWKGRRVLDFGCGAGRVLRHFAPEAAEAEFWGCDIDGPSVDWVAQNLCPPFKVMKTGESPGIPQPDGFFDLIYAMSVYTHITDHWAQWLLEHHRVLKDGGILIATFLGEGMIEELVGEPWVEEKIGMNSLGAGIPWDIGGPIVLHSPWWLRAHWGRAFDIIELRPHLGAVQPAGHGVVVLQRKDVRLSVEDLERLEPAEPRELSALQHQVEQLQREVVTMRHHIATLDAALAKAAEDQEEQRRLEASLGNATAQLRAIVTSRSWRITAPIRATTARLRGMSARRA